jgi:hypothetical protein
VNYNDYTGEECEYGHLKYYKVVEIEAGATAMNGNAAPPAGALTAKLTSAGKPRGIAHKSEKGQPASQSPPRRRWTRSRSAAVGGLSLIRVIAAPKSSMSNFNSPRAIRSVASSAISSSDNRRRTNASSAL